jgi:hypothetical protein
MKTFTVIITMLLWGTFALAQNIEINFQNAVACMDEPAEMHLMVSNFDSVNAITMHIVYEPQNTVFDSLTNIAAQVPGLLYNDVLHDVTQQPLGLILVSWSSTTGTMMGTDTLFTLNFIFQGVESPVKLDTTTEFADFHAVALPYTYTEGYLQAESIPEITAQPLDILTSVPGDNVQFFVQANNATGYQWQIKDNMSWVDLSDNTHFTGTNTNNLFILNIDAADDSTFYRCKILGCVENISMPAELNMVFGIEENDQFNQLLVYPNPSADVIRISSDKLKPGNYKLDIYNVSSQLVLSKEISINQIEIIEFDIRDLTPGNYSLRINSLSAKQQTSGTRFLITR